MDKVTLRDGTQAYVWPLLQSDREALIEGFNGLSPESRRLRFLTPVDHLTDSMLQRLVDDVDGIDHVALIMFAEQDGEMVPMTIGRVVRYPDLHHAADVAVTVKDAWQGRGAASAMLPLLMKYRPEGVTHLITEVAENNPASLAMLARLGKMHTKATRFGVLDVEIELEPGHPWPSEVAEDDAAKVGRLHPVLTLPWRESLRSRDLLCPWLALVAPDLEQKPADRPPDHTGAH